MRGRLQMLGILVQIALRNLFAGRLKTLIVGGIISLGSFVVVTGASCSSSISEGMAKSIIGSAAGHLQIYSSESKDDLALYGGMMGDPDLKPMPDFSKVKRTVMKVPNVERVVPMGIAQATASSGNQLDFALERLRNAVKKRQAGGEVPEAEYAAMKDHVRQMILLQQQDATTVGEMIEERANDVQGKADVERAAGEQFWSEFDRDALSSLEFLENKIAPQSVDGDFIFVSYIGTDLDLYRKTFDRFEIVEGTDVPRGQRGILFPKLYYEDWIKMKVALRLDKIRQARDLNHKTIAKDVELQRFVKENTLQLREVVMQLDTLKRTEMVRRLQRSLGSSEADVFKLLGQLFATDDANFDARYKIFYDDVAPLVKLYQVKPGDLLTIKAFTKAGYVKSVNVKLYGIYQLKGLEKSGFAGVSSLLDLMTFRDLYGFQTADGAAEIKKLKEASGAKAVSREKADEDLFGAGAQLVADSKQAGFDEFAGLDKSAARLVDETARVYSQDEIEQGVALNAAVMLKDPSRLKETAKQIEQAAQQDGLKLKVIDWKKAAGMVGQLITLLVWVLVVVVTNIFVVALVIIIDSMVMATMQRVKEIGTLRAIGAQRSFVLAMVIIETMVIGLLFGLIGSGLGALFIGWLGHVGIEAWRDEMQFIFSGPRLYPHLGGASVLWALGIVLVVSLVSAIYPAILATRVTPLEAMQSDD